LINKIKTETREIISMLNGTIIVIFKDTIKAKKQIKISNK
jgi:hypothetical protein